MRISAAAVVVVASVLTVAAADPKSQFFTSSDGVKIHYLELGTAGTPVILIHGYTANAEGQVKGAEIVVLPKETHGSVHLNPACTQTLVKFIDGHDR